MRKALLEAGLAAGRGFAARISPWREASLKSLLESGESLRLQYPREDLGFQYTQGAVNAAGAAGAAGGGVKGGRAVRGAPYVPCVAPGYRMPHCEVDVQQVAGGSRCLSTLDLVGTRNMHWSTTAESSSRGSTGSGVRPNALLILSADAVSSAERDVEHWAAAGSQLQASSWPLNVIRVLPPTAASSGHTAQPGAAVAAAHWSGTAVDVTGAWHQLVHNGQSAPLSGCAAAVLVRPDGHVAWVSPAKTGQHQLGADIAAAKLRAALENVLCMRPH